MQDSRAVACFYRARLGNARVKICLVIRRFCVKFLKRLVISTGNFTLATKINPSRLAIEFCFKSVSRTKVKRIDKAKCRGDRRGTCRAVLPVASKSMSANSKHGRLGLAEKGLLAIFRSIEPFPLSALGSNAIAFPCPFHESSIADPEITHDS